MRKLLIAVTAVFVASLGLMSAAGAQDPHIGNLEADPATVPEAGEYTMAVTGTGWLPDTSILLLGCTAPGDTLVAGVSTPEEITAAATEMLGDPLTNCDLAAALPIDVDGDGNFTSELTADVGDNFFVGAGALDQSQGGATWVPIVDPEAAAAAEEEPAEEEAAEEEPAEEEAAEEEPAEEDAAEEEPAEDLAETGVETGLLAVVGAAVLGAGVMVAREARRHS